MAGRAPRSRHAPRKRERRQALERRGLAALVACVAGLACLAASLLWALDAPRLAGPVGGPFALVDARGHTVTDRDFRGRYMLVYFGYTSCPDVCPTTLHDMAAAVGQLGAKAARVQPVFVTVDPQRDSPAVLRDYVDAIDPHMVALTGSEAAVTATLRSFRVQRAVQRLAGPHGGYVVDHTAVLYLMGPDGRFVAPVRADAPPEQMAAEIAQHVS